jgi:chloride channel 2
MIGLIGGLIAGLPIGREGPFIHMSACVASKLSKMKCFEDIDKNQALKRTMYSAAVAAGMTAAFGAPMGAIMFSIEVSTTYYMVSNLFKGFFCVSFTILVYKVFEMCGLLTLYEPTSYPMAIAVDYEIFLFAILGIICGIIGAMLI